MGHHSDYPGDSPLSEDSPERRRLEQERVAAFNEKIRKFTGQPLIGATGLHPEGKLTPHDEGGIQFAVGVKDGKVCLDFGTPVVWVGFSPEDALKLAESLVKHAREAARGTGTILTFNLG